MHSNPRVPDNSRDGSEIDVITFPGENDGASVEGQAHVLHASERCANEEHKGVGFVSCRKPAAARVAGDRLARVLDTG